MRTVTFLINEEIELEVDIDINLSDLKDKVAQKLAEDGRPEVSVIRFHGPAVIYKDLITAEVTTASFRRMT